MSVTVELLTTAGVSDNEDLSETAGVLETEELSATAGVSVTVKLLSTLLFETSSLFSILVSWVPCLLSTTVWLAANVLGIEVFLLETSFMLCASCVSNVMGTGVMSVTSWSKLFAFMSVILLIGRRGQYAHSVYQRRRFHELPLPWCNEYDRHRP